MQTLYFKSLSLKIQPQTERVLTFWLHLVTYTFSWGVSQYIWLDGCWIWFKKRTLPVQPKASWGSSHHVILLLYWVRTLWYHQTKAEPCRTLTIILCPVPEVSCQLLSLCNHLFQFFGSVSLSLSSQEKFTQTGTNQVPNPGETVKVKNRNYCQRCYASNLGNTFPFDLGVLVHLYCPVLVITGVTFQHSFSFKHYLSVATCCPFRRAMAKVIR